MAGTRIVKDGCCHLVVIGGAGTGDESSRDLGVREEIKKSNETHVFLVVRTIGLLE